jgi:hypothetical protein
VVGDFDPRVKMRGLIDVGRHPNEMVKIVQMADEILHPQVVPVFLSCLKTRQEIEIDAVRASAYVIKND